MSTAFHGTGTNYYLDFKLNGNQLVTSNIIHLAIREWILDVVPRIDFTLNDDGVISEIFPLLEGTQINIKLAKHSEDTNPIETNFELQDYTYGSAMGNKFLQVKGAGALQIKNLYSPKYNRSFRNKNSLDMFKLISGESGTAIKIPTGLYTSDLMTWYQIYQNNHNFIKHILKRSFKADDTLFSYFDMAGNMKVASLNTMLSQGITREARYDIEKYGEESFKEKADLDTMWFNSWNISSMSGYLNKTGAYGTEYGYYTGNKGFTNKILSDNKHSLTDQPTKNKDNIGNIAKHISFGYHNDKNVFADYFKAQATNDYLKKNFLSGIMLDMNVNALCPVRIGDMVNVYIPSTLMSGYNTVMSGKYLVFGIIHEVAHKDVYRKRVILFRNGVNNSSLVPAPIK
jgi:hypothetical protein